MRVNDFPALIEDHNTKCIMYADDTTLLVSSNTAEGLITNAANSLQKTQEYCNANNLVTNASKTIEVNFSKRGAHLTNTCSTAERKVEFLGITIDGGLSWNAHVDAVCKKLGSGIYVVRRVKCIATLEAAKAAYHALVESHLRYGLIVWGDCLRAI